MNLSFSEISNSTTEQSSNSRVASLGGSASFQDFPLRLKNQGFLSTNKQAETAGPTRKPSSD
jgi:hypothetical protein